MYHGTPESLDWLVQPVRPDAREAQSFEEALGRDDLGALTRAAVTVHLGWARLRGRAFDAAGRRFLEAEGAFSWSPWRAAECMLFRALSLLGGGDADGALALAEAAWSTSRAQARVRGEAEALVVLARSRWRLGQPDKARATAREAVRAAERSSAGWAFADGLRQSVEYQDHSVPELPARARVAGVVFRALGDLSSAGQCQLALGRLLAAQRAFPAAVKALRAARETLLPVSPNNAGNASLALARLLFKGGQRAAEEERNGLEPVGEGEDEGGLRRLGRLERDAHGGEDRERGAGTEPEREVPKEPRVPLGPLSPREELDGHGPRGDPEHRDRHGDEGEVVPRRDAEDAGEDELERDARERGEEEAEVLRTGGFHGREAYHAEFSFLNLAFLNRGPILEATSVDHAAGEASRIGLLLRNARLRSGYFSPGSGGSVKP
jgi:tetratricopeptide (TPR) repeat protein